MIFAIGMTLLLLMLLAAAIGVALKLCFALFTGIFGLVAGLVGILLGGVMMLLLAPLGLLCLVPAAFPLVLLIGAAWAIGRAGRTSSARRDVRRA